MGVARRIGTALAAGSIALASFLVAAPSASAVNLGTVTWNGTTLSGTSLSGQIGDTFTLQNSGSGGSNNGSIRNGTGTVSVSGVSCTVTSSIPDCPSFASSSITVTIVQGGQVSFWTSSLQGTITISVAGGGSSSASAPAPVVQQFARPTSGTCDAAQPAGLNWSGVVSGGWSESWAQWANGGRGGSVCTRTLEFVNGWRVAS